MTPAPSIAARAAHLAASSPDQLAYTFVDYSADIEGTAASLTWSGLDSRARGLAAELRRLARPGERAAILAPQGLGYVTAILGAFYANVIAVPLFIPDLPWHRDRLERIMADADPSIVLTTEDALAAVSAFVRDRRSPSLREILPVDGPGVPAVADWQPQPNDPDDVAYLQYTSGSTRAPAGVMVTHGCLSANSAQIAAALTLTPGSATAVGWLPLFHDMGLVMTVAMPIATGNQAVFIDPAAFLMRPVRWLELAARSPGAISAAPNFAYEYCATRIGEDDIASLDLSGVRAFINGAEPVRPGTLRRFASRFSRCGLSPAALVPAYGLAEATLYVASAAGRTPARIIAFDRDELALGCARPVPEDAPSALAMTSCGVPAGQHAVIVDPETATPCPPGQVGEIWVNGPNVAPGYFASAVAAPPGDRRDDASGQVFGARLADPGGGLPAEGWLRTGDLGVYDGGELFVTGRLKDLIVIDGRNHYPQDIEATVQTVHPAIRKDRLAAFAVATGDGDRVVVVAERADRDSADTDVAGVARAVRGIVATRHGIRLHDFLLVKPGAVPRTSSGKISRSASRERYLAGAFGTPTGR
jgi:fatty acid CoA ligase FadD32